MDSALLIIQGTLHYSPKAGEAPLPEKLLHERPESGEAFVDKHDPVYKGKTWIIICTF